MTAATAVVHCGGCVKVVVRGPRIVRSWPVTGPSADEPPRRLPMAGMRPPDIVLKYKCDTRYQ